MCNSGMPKNENFAMESRAGEEANSSSLSDLDGRIQAMAKECPRFYRNRNLLILYLLIIPGCLVPSVTLGFDTSMMNGLQSVPTWDRYFDKPRGSLLGILSAMVPLGAICATPFISIVGDHHGRRMGIFLGSLIMTFGGIIQGCSINIAMFLISRFIIGFGLVFANTYAPVLIGELAHPKDRQVITSLYQTTWYLGAILAAWIIFGTYSISSQWAWRIPSLLQAVPPLIQICAIWFLPESPRWLLAQGRQDEARRVLFKYHANGNEEDVFVQLEYKEMETIITAETTTKTKWRVLISTPANRRRVIILVMLGLFSQWSGNGLGSFYLTRVLETVGVKSAREQNIINGCLQIWNWACAVSSAFLTAHLRRRTQFLISVWGMLAAFSALTLCAGLFNDHNNKAASIGVIPMIFVFYAFFSLAFNALLYSYPVELLPYPIRAKGFSVLMFFGKSANFITALTNPIALKAIGWKYYIVYVGWLCVEVLGVYSFLVETKGPNLEGIAAKIENEFVVFQGDDREIHS